MSEFTGLIHSIGNAIEVNEMASDRYLVVCGSAELPPELDPRPWHRIENQGPVNSCSGFALSSVGELCYRVAAGQVRQFSPMWSYLRAQLVGNLFGRDGGATISGAVRAAQNDGFCPLEVFPYPQPPRYTTQIPAAAAEAASPFKIRGVGKIEGADNARTWLGTNQGGVLFALPWPLVVVNGICDSFTGYGNGFHAVAGLGYDQAGNIWIGNSHSTQWGDAGWFRLTPRAMDGLLRRVPGAVAVGLSDLTTPGPRLVDWTIERPMG